MFIGSTKKRTQTTASKAASMIRKDLKKTFPKTKFAVTSRSGSMEAGNVRVEWVNGPRTASVKKVTDKYEEPYRYDTSSQSLVTVKSKSELPQVTNVILVRKMSPELKKYLFSEISQKYAKDKSMNDVQRSAFIANEMGKDFESYDFKA